MSIITFQIGQCGNQIGEKFYETLISDCYDFEINKAPGYNKNNNELYINECKERFFTDSVDCFQDVKLGNHKNLYARSILIDMESKVVNKLLYNWSNSKFNYRETNSYTQKRGSGNNWSFGYCINGPNSLDKTQDMIRKEVERCDGLDSFLIFMSLAGGTGSGVGSFYTEFLRENYPRTNIVNTCVWPFSTGEVILQNYNFLLTLSKLYQHSDALILLENDVLHRICQSMYNNSGSKDKEINFNDLNLIIGHKIATILQPSSDEYSKNYLNDICASLCSHNDFKLLSLNNIPIMSKESIEYSTFQWNSLYKNARLLSTGGYMEKGNNDKILNKILSLNLFARGLSLSFNEHKEFIKNIFDLNYINKNFSYFTIQEPIKLWHQNRAFNNYEKSISMLSNSQMPAFKIEGLVNKAWKMFSTKAYVHQYVKYDNFQEEDLLNSFIFAEQLIKNYKNL